jgi:hypothetical protein
MSLLTVVLISGFAVGFATELFGLPIDYFTSFDSKILKQLLSAPFGALFAWTFGITGWQLIPLGLAAGFVSLVILHWMNRPVQVQQVVSNRVR